jgi:hypothetical protein
MVWTFRRFHRYLKSRPANEDNSIVAKGYAIVEHELNYSISQVTFGYQLRIY